MKRTLKASKLPISPIFGVVDLFSGCGGMSLGFHHHPNFVLLAAADAQIGKPSAGQGSLGCNKTYESNIGIKPKALNLSEIDPSNLRSALGLNRARVDVLSVCPPCTGFSRATPANHLRDDSRNNLVRKAALFATALDAEAVIMENARELMTGNFRRHLQWYTAHLQNHGYTVVSEVHTLTRFGLPQKRERALIYAVKKPLVLKTLNDLWLESRVKQSAISVDRAFRSIPRNSTERDTFPRFADDRVRARISAIPHDGGSWAELLKRPETEHLLTDAMKRILLNNRVGSHPDVYGRMFRDKPAPTIKRECAHIGNGRYAHPNEDRLCSVREMAALQGFPNTFRFAGSSVSNKYRQIGDAVPPLVAFQIACVFNAVLRGTTLPEPSLCILPDTHLMVTDIEDSDNSLIERLRTING